MKQIFSNRDKKLLKLIIYFLVIIISLDFIVVSVMTSKIKNICEEECNYIASPQYFEASYWLFEKKKFETQKQCIDYCFKEGKEKTGWRNFLWMKSYLKRFF